MNLSRRECSSEMAAALAAGFPWPAQPARPRRSPGEVVETSLKDRKVIQPALPDTPKPLPGVTVLARSG